MKIRHEIVPAISLVALLLSSSVILVIGSVDESNAAIGDEFTYNDIYGNSLKFEIISDDEVQTVPRGSNLIIGQYTYNNVIIPSTVTYNGNKYTVTAIGDGTFENQTIRGFITIPSTVRSIGDDAFSGPGSFMLEQITIGGSEPLEIGTWSVMPSSFAYASIKIYSEWDPNVYLSEWIDSGLPVTWANAPVVTTLTFTSEPADGTIFYVGRNETK